jgi:N6-adenosine-specific RNA methylase IME4
MSRCRHRGIAASQAARHRGPRRFEASRASQAAQHRGDHTVSVITDPGKAAAETRDPAQAQGESPMPTFAPHPLASLLPAMTGAEYVDLCDSIRANGLREPIMLHSDGRVLDGRHRMRACDELGIAPAVRTFAGTDAEALQYVLDLNLKRRHLDETQRAMVAAKLPGFAHGGDRRSDRAANLPLSSQAMRGTLLNVSERSVTAAVAVREHAIPEVVTACEQGALPVSKAAQVARLPEARQRQVAEELRNSNRSISTIVLGASRRERAAVIEAAATNCPLSLLGRRFPVLYADPPWRQVTYSDGGLLKAPEMHYPTMSVEDICAQPVADIAAENAVLFMWALKNMLPEALQVLAAWGFTFITEYVWRKPNFSCGHWLRGQHEPLLLATRGSMPPPPPSDLHGSVFEGPASGEHSGKPECVRDWIADAYPECSWIELFARAAPAPGWTVWGNQALTAAAAD